MTRDAGKLIGVGVGPGDPELLTLRAVRAIREAHVVAYPQLGDTPSMARQIAADHIRDGRREIALRVPLTGGAEAQAAYDLASDQIAGLLEQGFDVAALCEGDPLVYGSFIALWSRLTSRFACEIIPGISSILAGPARLQVPLVSGNSCLSVLPGTLDDDALSDRLSAGGAFLIVKVGRHVCRLKALVKSHGLLARAYYLERATLGSERAMLLENFDEPTAPYFSMIVIGDVTRGQA